MFKSKPLAALVALACAQAAMANQPVTLDEVVVTATRTATPVAKVLSDVTVIGEEEIRLSTASNLPQLLASFAGVEMASNGGAGTNASLFLRGCNSNHVVILIDGIRITEAGGGTTKLQLIPLSQLERIEVLRGPASSLYGADAIGGVIQVFTKQPTDTTRFTAHAGVGSDKTYQADLAVSGKLDRLGYVLSLSQEQSDGFSAQPKGNPDDDGYVKQAYDAKLQYELVPGHSLNLNLYQTFSRTEYDQSSSGQDTSRSRQTGRSLELKNTLAANWQSSLRLIQAEDFTREYTAGNTSKASSRFDGERKEAVWHNDVDTAFGKFALGFNKVKQDVEAQASYVPGGYKQKQLDTDAAYLGYQQQLGTVLLQGSVRKDDTSLFGNKTTGQLGAGVELGQGWLLRVAKGTAFKAPSFNDFVVNPDIKPEKAKNQEAALRWQQGVHRATLTYFNNEVEDLINWAPVGGGVWKPSNIDRAKMEGFSLDTRTRVAGVDVLFNVTNQKARNGKTGVQLARRAKEYGTLTVSKAFDQQTVALEVQGVGQRNDSGGTLHGYGVANLSLNHAINNDWTLEARLNNVFDREYEKAKGYATGGRGWFLGVRYAQ
jgi:vitamin B12 transporter